MDNTSLDIVQRATWVRVFTLTDNNQCCIGQAGWGAEFVLLNPNNPQQIIIAASTANGKAWWVAAGQLAASFTSQDTAGIPAGDYSFFLRLVDPTTTIDPNGFGTIVLNGFLSVVTSAPANVLPGASLPSSLNPFNPCACNPSNVLCSPGILSPVAPPFALGMGQPNC